MRRPWTRSRTRSTTMATEPQSKPSPARVSRATDSHRRIDTIPLTSKRPLNVADPSKLFATGTADVEATATLVVPPLRGCGAIAYPSSRHPRQTRTKPGRASTTSHRGAVLHVARRR
jgi:hypothetical protein